MNRYFTLLLAGIMGISFTAGCSKDDSNTTAPPEATDPVPVTKTNTTKVYMHYMPWFESKESSGNNQWGYHWTMGNKNPDITDANGKRQIASHYYPLIGPYHSGDRDVIENHLLLMKYAGVDGILIDWYGTYDLNDYRINKENSEALIDMLDEVGLEYAIVYEDRFLTNIVDAGLAPAVTSAARTDMAYMQNNYFNDANYIKISGKPLLLAFGPITLNTPGNWTTVFGNLNPKPHFLTLWYESAEAGANAAGEYAWVYQDNTHISNFYGNRVPSLGFSMGSAYPGFKDYYQEGGGGAAIGWTIPHGTTFDETLAMATASGTDYLQLVTWNDFGEGTMIEPTVEFGYSYVNKVKAFTNVQNTGDVFADISRLFELRKYYKGNSSVQAKLNKAFGYFVSMQPERAVQQLDEIE